MITAEEVKRTERGWLEHYVCSPRCLFRRNTLLEYGDIKIVVSTVGHMQSCDKGKIKQIGPDRYYETLAFHSDPGDERYHYIDIWREVSFKSPWSINRMYADDKANEMHEAVVAEISAGLIGGNTYDPS